MMSRNSSLISSGVTANGAYRPPDWDDESHGPWVVPVRKLLEVHDEGYRQSLYYYWTLVYVLRAYVVPPYMIFANAVVVVSTVATTTGTTLHVIAELS